MIDTTKKADEIRKDVLKVAIENNQGHIAPSLSCVDILTVLFYRCADEMDTIILSKGHGCYGLYAICADLGLIKPESWRKFDLPGCVEGYGSLGHGLPVATGIAFANDKLGNNKHVWVIVGDGELQEGSNWEALSFIYHHRLQNITIIVDYNEFQAMDKTDHILFQNLRNRLYGWGFQPRECNGHDHSILIYQLDRKPSVLLAHTVKGKGVGYMENRACWHFRVPKENNGSK